MLFNCFFMLALETPSSCGKDRKFHEVVRHACCHVETPGSKKDPFNRNNFGDTFSLLTLLLQQSYLNLLPARIRQDLSNDEGLRDQYSHLDLIDLGKNGWNVLYCIWRCAYYKPNIIFTFLYLQIPGQGKRGSKANQPNLLRRLLDLRNSGQKGKNGWPFRRKWAVWSSAQYVSISTVTRGILSHCTNANMLFAKCVARLCWTLIIMPWLSAQNAEKFAPEQPLPIRTIRFVTIGQLWH